MEKDFCTYEQALELKKLGFNHQCMSYYSHYGNGKVHLNDFGLYSKIGVMANDDKAALAPIYSQALRWFRDKYVFYISMVSPDFFYFVVHFKNDAEKANDIFMSKHFETYEEAEHDCLNKLIEIAKNK